MAKGTRARRYSQAVFELALEKDELERWQSDLKQIASLGEDAELIASLESPKLRFDAKAKLLSERLGDMNPLALNLAYLLVTRGGFNMVNDIAVEYQRLVDSYRGIEQAEVSTAVPLVDEDRQRLTQHLGELVGRKVVLESKVDASVIGGFIARIGGKLLDGSTRGKLEALRKELAGAGK